MSKDRDKTKDSYTHIYKLPIVSGESKPDFTVSSELLIPLDKAKGGKILSNISYGDLKRYAGVTHVKYGEQRFSLHEKMSELNKNIDRLGDQKGADVQKDQGNKDTIIDAYYQAVEKEIRAFYEGLCLGNKDIANTLLQYVHQSGATSVAQNFLRNQYQNPMDIKQNIIDLKQNPMDINQVPAYGIYITQLTSYFQEPDQKIVIDIEQKEGRTIGVKITQDLISTDKLATIRCVSTITEKGNIALTEARATFTGEDALGLEEKIKKTSWYPSYASKAAFTVFISNMNDATMMKDKAWVAKFESYKSMAHIQMDKKPLLDKLFDKLLKLAQEGTQQEKTGALLTIYLQFWNCDIKNKDTLDQVTNAIKTFEEHGFFKPKPSFFQPSKSDTQELVTELSEFLSKKKDELISPEKPAVVREHKR